MAILQIRTILNGNRAVAGFSADKNDSASFKLETKIAGRIGK